MNTKTGYLVQTAMENNFEIEHIDIYVKGIRSLDKIDVTMTLYPENKHTYKMYSIVLRQLDGINNGVQTTHGVCEYIRKHWNDEDLQQWLNEDKTLVVLNGGTVNDMNSIKERFDQEGIKYETFEEEDLANLTTSICLLADERVWDRKEYGSVDDFVQSISKKQLVELEPEKSEELVEAEKQLMEEIEREVNKQYETFVGGRENVVKKEVLNNLRLI